MSNYPNYIKITEKGGFNRLEREDRSVIVDTPDDNPELFLLKNNKMISLGRYSSAKMNAGEATNRVVDANLVLLGNFGTPQIDDNLYILAMPPSPPPSQTGGNLKRKTRRYKKLRSRGNRSRGNRSRGNRSRGNRSRGNRSRGNRSKKL
jgi:hypothetical protein